MRGALLAGPTQAAPCRTAADVVDGLLAGGLRAWGMFWGATTEQRPNLPIRAHLVVAGKIAGVCGAALATKISTTGGSLRNRQPVSSQASATAHGIDRIHRIATTNGLAATRQTSAAHGIPATDGINWSAATAAAHGTLRRMGSAQPAGARSPRNSRDRRCPWEPTRSPHPLGPPRPGATATHWIAGAPWQ